MFTLVITLNSSPDTWDVDPLPPDDNVLNLSRIGLGIDDEFGKRSWRETMD